MPLSISIPTKSGPRIEATRSQELALMFAVKDSDAIERPSGEKAVGRNRPELRRARSGARDDG
jgi:hypothetical protein